MEDASEGHVKNNLWNLGNDGTRHPVYSLSRGQTGIVTYVGKHGEGTTHNQVWHHQRTTTLRSIGVAFNKKKGGHPPMHGIRCAGWPPCKGRSYWATFCQIFLFLFQAKQEKQEKQETFPMLGNLRKGKMFGRLGVPSFGEKRKTKKM